MKKILKKIQLIVPFLLMTSCALFTEVNNEYTIRASKNGAKVFSKSGKLLGTTPAHLSFEQIKNTIDGKFATLLVQKEGYNSRVIMFDITDSVNVSIDLEVDKTYSTNIRDGLYVMIEKLEKANSKLQQKNTELIKMISHADGKSTALEEKVQLLKNQENILLERIKNMITYQDKLKNVKFLTDVEPVVKPKSYSMTYKNLCREKIINKTCPKTRIRKVNYSTKQMDSIISKLLRVQFMLIRGEFSEARENILSIEEMHPNIATVYTLLAYIEMQSRDYAKAKKYLSQSLKLNKNDSMAKRMLAVLDVKKLGAKQ